MGITIEKYILAIVSVSRETVIAGGAPVFIVDSKEKMQRTAFLLEKILDGIAHDLENGTIIIVRHR
ncbi:MAG: hypothetical protein AB7V16_09660 [Vulcanibacillus sp.]